MKNPSFKYSGNKTRLIKLLPSPVGDTIIEPFAGSASYSFHYKPKRLYLAEKSVAVRELLTWLFYTASVDDLRKIEKTHFVDKQDVRSLNLPLPIQTLLRLSCSGVYVGQLSSWALYRQHKINYDGLADNLAWFKSAIQMIEDDYLKVRNVEGFHFIDPPYEKTSANYSQKCGILPSTVQDYFLEQKNAIITYGDSAAETFPKIDWKLACIRKVPNIRCGGTVDRKEHYSLKVNNG